MLGLRVLVLGRWRCHGSWHAVQGCILLSVSVSPFLSGFVGVWNGGLRGLACQPWVVCGCMIVMHDVGLVQDPAVTARNNMHVCLCVLAAAAAAVVSHAFVTV